MTSRFPFLLLCTLFLSQTGLPAAQPAPKPNVILIITDDQGYGDVAAHGNDMLRTPHLDKLHAESLRLTDYHVDPTCSPTRAALLTGRYSTRTGVWHTIMGRSIMRPEELTLAEVFQKNGYRTGHLGKWHLGDNYPCRPQDQGFETVLMHRGGGVGQGPDYWGNDYFDDTYWRNGEEESFSGYCTDVWFDEALDFIAEHQEEPFFLYLTTNAPHGPYLVAEEYWRPYAERGISKTMARFYGMIENIDDNVGRLRQRLQELHLEENTVFIFTTDNGSAVGEQPRQDGFQGYNAGMRGRKGSEYDGGHRVPFFIRWPAGRLNEAKDVPLLTAHVDVLPTLVELCELQLPSGPPLDGRSLAAVLRGEENQDPAERVLFVHSQRIQHPEKWRKSSVMTERWRLVNRTELFDIEKDPQQAMNLADTHPEIATKLQSAYDDWWETLRMDFDEKVRIWLGNEQENPVELMAHDWHCDDQRDCPWHQNHVRNGLAGNGPWAVYVEQAGAYEITLLRWPEHLARPMNRVEARFELGQQTASMKLDPADTKATFKIRLPRGSAEFRTWLRQEDGTEHGAYFAKIKRLE